MPSKTPKPPTTQRQFRSPWSELDYLCKKIRYWLYARGQRRKAEHYLNRLQRVLHQLPDNDLAIIRAEGWALLCELKGRIDDAIAHRQREIELIEKLHEEAKSPTLAPSTRAYMLRDCDTRTLKQRIVIVQALKKKALQQRREVGTAKGS